MPAASPLVSVIVPWIGRPDYIADTLAALLRQDYAKLEVIVSDNSLSSPVIHLLPGAADPRIRIIERNEKRLSSADHFSACVRDAAGEYVMILSDDDLVEPGYVSGMMDALRLYPDSAAILGEQIVIGKDHRVEPPDSGAHKVAHFPGVSFFVHRLLRPRALPIITYVSVFARRADMLSFPYRDYPDGSNSDNYMMLCLALEGSVSLSSRKLYYRVYENSSGLKTPFAKLLESCATYESDAARVTKHRLGVVRSLPIRCLIRVRNATMMGRRLARMYRKRMSLRQFLVASGLLLLYFAGVIRSTRVRAGKYVDAAGSKN